MREQEAKKTEEPPQEGNLWLNIGRIIFLVAVLVAAWFILDRLIGGK